MEKTSTTNSEVTTSANEKKVYQKPELTPYGDIAALVMTGPSTTSDDNGTGAVKTA